MIGSLLHLSDTVEHSVHRGTVCASSLLDLIGFSDANFAGWRID
jgi:hypothetical protein